jgi:ABC-type phosphate transport system ATPase subunit
MVERPVKIEVRDLGIAYHGKPALEGVNLQVREHEIFGIIGPANAGKTSFLKALNRMDAFNPQMRVTGDIHFNGSDVRRMRNLYAGGQQQRLTIARALSQEPEVLMLDEFSIAVDPVTTMRIEDVLKELKSEMTIILVTTLVQQARRLADRTAFFLDGRCVEIGLTDDLFEGSVQSAQTLDYIQGKFG